MSEAAAMRNAIVPSMDRMYDQLRTRLEGLTAKEYLWEPIANMWSVQDSADGPHVDGVIGSNIDPAPVSTIAWRIWHISIRCFDYYTRCFAGDQTPVPTAWTLDPGAAIASLDATWTSYRSTITERDFDSKLGPNWGPWADANVADMAMHASNELVHHGAEIALLRDLYRDQPLLS